MPEGGFWRRGSPLCLSWVAFCLFGRVGNIVLLLQGNGFVVYIYIGSVYRSSRSIFFLVKMISHYL